MVASKPAADTNHIRVLLATFLLAAAPFSFNPSWALPLEGFVSFRIGLYQLAIILFVLMMAPLIWRNRARFIHDYWVTIPSIILVILLISSPFRSYNHLRSGLLSGSVLLLVCLLVSGYVFAQKLLSKTTLELMSRVVVGTALAVGVFSVLQLIVNSFEAKSLGLCNNCGAGVFGFPRVNGFAAEPQFFASALLPGILLLAAQALRYQLTKKVVWSFGFLVFVLTLTLSRGGYVAATVGAIALVLALYFKKQLSWQRVFVLGVVGVASIFAGFTAMTLSATVRHYKTNRMIATETMATIIEHSSAGAIDLPYNNPKPTTNPTSTFQTPGAIEASHEDRESAASLGLRWWRQNSTTLLFGLGGGNLGSFAARQNLGLPLSFTIYMQYIFILVELGILGLISFLFLLVIAIKRAIYRINKRSTPLEIALGALLISFAVQYLFFGSYINVPYVWLYTGLGLGIFKFRANN